MDEAIDRLKKLGIKRLERKKGASGWGLVAEAPWLKKSTVVHEIPVKPQIQVGDDGNVYVLMTFESFNQFPSPNFIELQEALTEFMVDAFNNSQEVEKRLDNDGE